MVSAADDFEAVFVTEAGVERRLPDVVDELGDRFGRSRRIAVNATSAGWYWSSTLGRLVGFESWVKRITWWRSTSTPRWSGSCPSRFGCSGRQWTASGAVMLRISWCVRRAAR